MTRRRVPLLLVLATIAVLLLLLFSLASWGKPRLVAEVTGELLSPPVGEGGTVAWLERRGDGDHLRARGRGDVLHGAALGGLAIADDTAYTTRSGKAGEPPVLWSVDLGPALLGGSGRTTLSAPAAEMVANKMWTCWLSTREAALPKAPFVVAGASVTAVWAISIRERLPHLVARTSASGPVHLLGAHMNEIYWTELHGDSTRLRRHDLSTGKSETVAREPGRQSAVLLEDRLAWTAPSQAAAPAAGSCCVKVQSLSDDEPTVIADWLAPGVVLLGSGQTLYAQEREALWRLGPRRGDQRRVCRTSYGGRMPYVGDGVEYLVVEEAGRTRLIRRGLTWGGKLRVLLNL